MDREALRGASHVVISAGAFQIRGRLVEGSVVLDCVDILRAGGTVAPAPQAAEPEAEEIRDVDSEASAEALSSDSEPFEVIDRPVALPKNRPRADLRELPAVRRPLPRPAAEPEAVAEPAPQLVAPPALGEGELLGEARPRQLTPRLLRRLTVRLRTTGNFSAEDRIRRAWDAGKRAARVLSGEWTRPGQTPPLPGLREEKVYVVLRSAQGAFHTDQAIVYFDAVSPHGNWDIGSVSHCFPSIREAEAYSLGAGVEELPPYRGRA